MNESEVEEIGLFVIGFKLKRGIINDIKIVNAFCGGVTEPDPEKSWTHPDLQEFDALTFIEVINNVIYTSGIDGIQKLTHQGLITHCINFLELERTLIESPKESEYEQTHKEVYERTVKNHIRKHSSN